VDHLAAWRAAFESIGYVWIGQTRAFAKMKPPEAVSGRLPLDIILVEEATLSKLVAGSAESMFASVKYPSRHQKLGFQESLPFLRVFAPSCETPVFRKRDAVEYNRPGP
jgi:hypothetical protein